jgi:hypothetical protein
VLIGWPHGKRSKLGLTTWFMSQSIFQALGAHEHQVVLALPPLHAPLTKFTLHPPCATHTRRLNAFNYNKLLPRTTTGAALMQNGSLMARFAAPTCWNLLHMAHMDGVLDAQGTTTVFTQVRVRRPNGACVGLCPRHAGLCLPLSACWCRGRLW